MAILLCSTRARWGRTVKFILKTEGAGANTPQNRMRWAIVLVK